jgi:hypothetical protein
VGKNRGGAKLFDLHQQLAGGKYMRNPQRKILTGKDKMSLSPEKQKVIINKGLL